MSPFEEIGGFYRLDEYVDRDEAKYRSSVDRQRYRRAEFLSNEPWPIVEFLSFSPAFSFFPPLLFYRVSRRVRLHVQSSNINFKVGWDRVTRNRVNNRVKM